MSIIQNFAPQSDTLKLLDEQNQLVGSVIEKYRSAGQIAQSALQYVIGELENYEKKISLDIRVKDEELIPRICSETDAIIIKLCNQVHKSVKEKGIAEPTEINVGKIIRGYSPEFNSWDSSNTSKSIEPIFGDIAKISLAVHIDGYTVVAGHTHVITLQRQEAAPLTGPGADSICAAHIATEAICTLLSSVCTPERPFGQVTGSSIRTAIDCIANSFNCSVAPGSRIRRIRRFLAGQGIMGLQNESGNENDFKGIIWDYYQEENNENNEKKANIQDDNDNDMMKLSDFNDFQIEAGECWLVDISMVSNNYKIHDNDENNKAKNKDIKNQIMEIKPSLEYQPTIYNRDFNAHYNLKFKSSRALLSKVESITSVFPFKLSSVVQDEKSFKQAKLGLLELINSRLVVPIPVRRAANSEITYVARECATILLNSGNVGELGYAIRLSGGEKVAGPSWVSSSFKLKDDRINLLLDPKKYDIRIKLAQPLNYIEKESKTDTMEIE